IAQTNDGRREWMLKKFEFAAKRVSKGVNYKVWQDGFHPIHLSSNTMINQRLEYIHQNRSKKAMFTNLSNMFTAMLVIM
ncbi:MAG: hypothetical protein ABJD58_09340, partial [Cyclobacteriaceae bacterium]